MIGLRVAAFAVLVMLCGATEAHNPSFPALKSKQPLRSGNALDAAMFKGDSWKSQLTYKEKLIAGSLARFAAQSSLHPLEVLKARAQSKGGSLAPFTADTLLKGSVPQVGLSMPAGALQFSCIELAKEAIHANPLLTKLMNADTRNFVAGLLGTFVSMLIKVPQEVLKQGCQTGLYANAWVALSTVLRTKGVMGLYRGFWAQVARDLPWNALSFMLFNLGKRYWETATGRVSSDSDNMLLGAIAGGIAGFVSNPIDVVKTRIMTQPLGGEMAYAGIVQTLLKIVDEEGIAVLFRGTLYRVLYLAPLAAIIYSTYEAAAKRLLARRLLQQQPSPLRNEVIGNT